MSEEVGQAPILVNVDVEPVGPAHGDIIKSQDEQKKNKTMVVNGEINSNVLERLESVDIDSIRSYQNQVSENYVENNSMGNGARVRIDSITSVHSYSSTGQLIG